MINKLIYLFQLIYDGPSANVLGPNDVKAPNSDLDKLLQHLKYWLKDKKSDEWDTLAIEEARALGNEIIEYMGLSHSDDNFVVNKLKKLITRPFPLTDKSDELVGRCLALSTASTVELPHDLKGFIDRAKTQYLLTFPNKKELVLNRAETMDRLIRASNEIDLTDIQYRNTRINIIFCKEGRQSQTDVVTATEQYINKCRSRAPDRTILVLHEYDRLEEILSICNKQNITVHLTNIAHGSTLSLGYLDLPHLIKTSLSAVVKLQEEIDIADTKRAKKIAKLQADLNSNQSAIENVTKKIESGYKEGLTNNQLQKLKTQLGSYSSKKKLIIHEIGKTNDEFRFSHQRLLAKLYHTETEAIKTLSDYDIHHLDKNALNFIYTQIKAMNYSRSRIIGAYLDNIRLNIGLYFEEVQSLIRLINHHPSIYRVRFLSCLSAYESSALKDDFIHFPLPQKDSPKYFDGRVLNHIALIKGVEESTESPQDSISIDKDSAIRYIASQINRDGVIIKGETDVINPGINGLLAYHSKKRKHVELYDVVDEDDASETSTVPGSVRFFKPPAPVSTDNKAILDAIRIIKGMQTGQLLKDQDIAKEIQPILHKLSSYPADHPSKRRSPAHPWKLKYVLALMDKLREIEDNLTDEIESAVPPTSDI